MDEDHYLAKPVLLVRAFRFTATNSDAGAAWLLEHVAGVETIRAGDVAVVDAAGMLTLMSGPEFDAAYAPVPSPGGAD